MPNRIDEIAGRLSQAREAGDFCPEWLPGTLSLDDALAIQLWLLDRELASGERLAGWKVGLTSARARAALGADVRPFGYILESRVYPSGAQVDSSLISRSSIEPEMVFTFASAISGSGAKTTRDDVIRAVATVSAGYELNERRPGTARTDLPAMVTDRLTQWGIVVGEGVPAASVDVNGVRCELSRDGVVLYAGVSRDELDDHYTSLCRLVEGLAVHGRGIEAGQRVITGAFARYDANAGEGWRAEYRGVGSVEVQFK